jgi:hypothetical protein
MNKRAKLALGVVLAIAALSNAGAAAAAAPPLPPALSIPAQSPQTYGPILISGPYLFSYTQESGGEVFSIERLNYLTGEAKTLFATQRSTSDADYLDYLTVTGNRFVFSTRQDISQPRVEGDDDYDPEVDKAWAMDLDGSNLRTLSTSTWYQSVGKLRCGDAMGPVKSIGGGNVLVTYYAYGKVSPRGAPCNAHAKGSGAHQRYAWFDSNGKQYRSRTTKIRFGRGLNHLYGQVSWTGSSVIQGEKQSFRLYDLIRNRSRRVPVKGVTGIAYVASGPENKVIAVAPSSTPQRGFPYEIRYFPNAKRSNTWRRIVYVKSPHSMPISFCGTRIIAVDARANELVSFNSAGQREVSIADLTGTAGVETQCDSESLLLTSRSTSAPDEGRADTRVVPLVPARS